MSAIEVRPIVEMAADILSDPERWTQGSAARDIRGTSVGCESPEACTFCAAGALGRAAFLLGGSTYPSYTNFGGATNALAKALQMLKTASLARYDLAPQLVNDGPDPVAAYRQVLALYQDVLRRQQEVDS